MGNWKMHGSLASNQQLLAQLLHGLVEAHEHSDIVVCAPHPYLPQLQEHLKTTPIQWGAQNVNANAQGAFTGEVSVAMLQDFGCAWVKPNQSKRQGTQKPL